MDFFLLVGNSYGGSIQKERVQHLLERLMHAALPAIQLEAEYSS